MSPFRPNRERGMVLLGVIVLAAIVLIGAATIGVIYVRQLNQTRQLQTQKQLETAFHGLFSGYRKQAGNLNSDFAYSPTQPVASPPAYYDSNNNMYYFDLKMLVDRTAVGTSDATHSTVAQFGGTPSGATFSAWNGPYWTGSVDVSNRPTDAWGRPIQLRYITTSIPMGWQVFSTGVNGLGETGDSPTPLGDDQVYPNQPYTPPVAAPSTGDITFSVRITNNSGSTSPATQVKVVDTLQTQLSSKTAIPKNQVRTFTFTSMVQSGTITITITNSHGAVSTTPMNPYVYSLSSSPLTQILDISIP